MGKVIRRVVAVLLAVTALILAVLPAGTANATTTHGDYEYDGNTIVKYLGNESEVTVPNWVTKIGKDAFSGNENLEKIVLPDSVKTIDYAAFEDCINLQYAQIPSSVRTIGSSAFSGCKRLNSVSLPENLDNLGSGVFAGCSSLTTVPVDGKNLYYTCIDGVIYTKDGKELVQYLAGRPYTSYSMPGTVNKIDEYAFWGASNLNKVSISNYVKEIPEYAFSNCNGLIKLQLPNSVERINAFAFSDCSNLKLITIPDSVGFIDDRAFHSTRGTKLSFVDTNGNIVREANSDDVSAYGSGEENIDSDEGSGNNTVAAITQSTINTSDYNASNDSEDETTDEETVDNSNPYNGSFSGESTWVSEIDNTDYSDNTSPGEIGSSKILGGNALVFIPSDTPVINGYDLNNAENEDDYALSSTDYDNDSDDNIIGNLYSLYKGSNRNVTVPDGIEHIGNRAFYQNKNIINITLPQTIEDIDDFAFARSTIQTIDIPAGTKKIDYGAFYNCNDLHEIFIPSSIEDIELGAFDGTRWIDDWRNNNEADDFLIVGDGILLEYKGSESKVKIPSIVKKIGPGSFEGNNNIKSVEFPDSIIEVGEDAFNNCKNLSELTLNNGLLKIRDRAFKNTAIRTLLVPSSVEEIGLGAFDTTANSNSLKTVIFAGNKIPDVSYNDTATRLSAENLRTRAFEGVKNVIVNDKCDLNSGTLFDPRYYGFAGQVYVPENDEYNKTLLLKKSTSLPDKDGIIDIDPHVTIGNEKYIMDNVKNDAFDSYDSWPLWCEYKPQKINVSGNASDELLDMLNGLIASIPDNYNNNNGIIVNVTGKSFKNTDGSAFISDNSDLLYLNIYEDSNSREAINTSYNELHNKNLPTDAVYLSIDLYDNTMTIPIHKLGESKLEIKMPLPTVFSDSDKIRISCLDDNDLLTDLSNEIISEGDNKYVNFVTSHCSYFVLYSDSKVYNQLIEYTVDNEEYLYAPNFGGTIIKSLNREVSGGIEVKWFVIVILLSLSGLLLLYKPRKIKKIKK